MSFATSLLLVGLAHAEGFDAQRYQPPAGAEGGLLVERADVPAHLGWSVGLVTSYADDPVVLSDAASGEVLEKPVDALWGLDLVGSLGLFDRVELALDVPVVPVSAGDDLALGGQTLTAGPGLGDVRFVPKGVVFRRDGEIGVVVGVQAPVTFPTGDEDRLRGAGEVSVEPGALVDVVGGRAAFHGGVGFRVRPGVDPVDPIGHELAFGAALAYAPMPESDALDLLLEAKGAADVSSPGPQLTDVPLELLAGVAWRPAKGWAVTAGAGPGLTDGLGTPDFRVAAGVRFSPVPAEPAKDTDGDGIGDPDDRCPTRPEDRDGFKDRDGCPEPDNDGDRVLDDQDECPQIAEPPGGDGDGCPDRGRVRVEKGRLDIGGKVLFASGSDAIDPRSDALLDDVAKMFQERAELKRVEIQGHTDDVGDAAMNDDLSRRRAEAVKRALIDRGVAADRLTTAGFGERSPIAPNDTPAGRARNRRVEFIVKE